MAKHELVRVATARGSAGKRTTFYGRCSCGFPIGSSASPSAVERKHREHAARMKAKS